MASSTRQLFDMQIGLQASSIAEHFAGSRCSPSEWPSLLERAGLLGSPLSLQSLTVSEALCSSVTLKFRQSVYRLGGPSSRHPTPNGKPGHEATEVMEKGNLSGSS